MYLHINRLKARLLPQETVEATRYDDRLTAIAQGVAAAFDVFCGRTLLRAASVVETLVAGSGVYFLSRYPVESVSDVTLVLDDGSERALSPSFVNKRSGIVHFSEPEGSQSDTVEITYTGGYFVDLSANGDTALPSGATALPADLLDAWVLQCDQEARMRKVFGGTQDDDLSKPFDAKFDLIPRVERVLRAYQKMI